jgi:acetyl-CoA C-acetyltransferase
MGDAVIVSTARTPIGTAFKGPLVEVGAYELGTRAVAEALRRSSVDPALVVQMMGGGMSTAVVLDVG